MTYLGNILTIPTRSVLRYDCSFFHYWLYYSVVAKVRIFGTSGQTMLSDSCTIIRKFVEKMMGIGTQNQYCIRLYFLVAPTHQFTTGRLTCHYYRCFVLLRNCRTPLQQPSATALQKSATPCRGKVEATVAHMIS